VKAGTKGSKVHPAEGEIFRRKKNWMGAASVGKYTVGKGTKHEKKKGWWIRGKGRSINTPGPIHPEWYKSGGGRKAIKKPHRMIDCILRNK